MQPQHFFLDSHTHTHTHKVKYVDSEYFELVLPRSPCLCALQITRHGPFRTTFVSPPSSLFELNERLCDLHVHLDLWANLTFYFQRSSQHASQGESSEIAFIGFADCSYWLSRPLEFVPPLSTFLCLVVLSLCSTGSPLNSTVSLSGESGKQLSSNSERLFPFGP